MGLGEQQDRLLCPAWAGCLAGRHAFPQPATHRVLPALPRVVSTPARLPLSPPNDASQASQVSGMPCSQLEEQWEQAPHIMVCMQVCVVCMCVVWCVCLLVGLGMLVPAWRVPAGLPCLVAHTRRSAPPPRPSNPPVWAAHACLPACLELCLARPSPSPSPTHPPLPAPAPPPPPLLQPQEFVDAVLHDRLASLLSLLESRAPGHRPYLLVCGLAHHTLKHDRRQHDACMRGGGAAVGGAAGAGVGAGAQRAVRAVVEEFVTELAVRCPRLGFRDVVDAAQVRCRLGRAGGRWRRAEAQGACGGERGAAPRVGRLAAAAAAKARAAAGSRPPFRAWSGACRCVVQAAQHVRLVTAAIASERFKDTVRRAGAAPVPAGMLGNRTRQLWEGWPGLPAAACMHAHGRRAAARLCVRCNAGGDRLAAGARQERQPGAHGCCRLQADWSGASPRRRHACTLSSYPFASFSFSRVAEHECHPPGPTCTLPPAPPAPQALTNHLLNNQLDDPGLEPFLKSITAVPAGGCGCGCGGQAPRLLLGFAGSMQAQQAYGAQPASLTHCSRLHHVPPPPLIDRDWPPPPPMPPPTCRWPLQCTPAWRMCWPRGTAAWAASWMPCWTPPGGPRCPAGRRHCVGGSEARSSTTAMS